jgi:hypothetical protein
MTTLSVSISCSASTLMLSLTYFNWFLFTIPVTKKNVSSFPINESETLTILNSVGHCSRDFAVNSLPLSLQASATLKTRLYHLSNLHLVAQAAWKTTALRPTVSRFPLMISSVFRLVTPPVLTADAHRATRRESSLRTCTAPFAFEQSSCGASRRRPILPTVDLQHR